MATTLQIPCISITSRLDPTWGQSNSQTENKPKPMKGLHFHLLASTLNVFPNVTNGLEVQEFMTKLSISEIEEGLKTLPGWIIQDGKLTKQFELSSFPDLVSLVVKIGFVAEAADHHPDMLINYRRLTFMLSTHTLGGVSEKDLELAKQIEAALNRY